MYQKYFKRLLDVILAISIMTVFILPCIVVAIAIKFDTEGPIFADAPKRVGQGGRLFRMYKFRSMIVNAHNIIRNDPKYKELFEKFRNNSFKLNDDPRVTRVGKIIRKYSLDEVPQIINVLIGQMSVIGPRAYYQDELDHQSERYPEVKKEIDKVLSIKPGITGLWQVSGRSEVNFDKRILIDAKYVSCLSLRKDLEILIKTPIVMLSGRGAS
jgi:lipopolysaccharide/colanic/teichoic acid biosynthesis glycosyltransferase